MLKEPEIIVFDLGNVLIPFDYTIIIKKLEKNETGLGNKFYDKYKENYHVHRQLEKWELSNEQFLEIMLDWLDHKVNAEEFCEIYSNIFTVNKDLTEMLPKLKKNYPLVLLSNTNDIHRKYGWQKYSFLENFDKLILSYEVGAIKPEAEIYEAVMKFTNAQPASHLFIDDIPEYVNGAKKNGLGCISISKF
jgi:HAD superfamily hydrolase (TIGR01509 family)